jgi:hypothetical protein
MHLNKNMAALLAVAAMVPTLAVAKTTHSRMSSKMGSKTTAAATYKCPKCGMPMATTKSKAAPFRVAVNHHYYYCCTACGLKGDNAATSSGKMHGKMGGKMGGKMSSKMGGKMSGKM